MSREWKSGDVAMVNGDVCVYLGPGPGWEHGRPDRFSYNATAVARPLVVIDPEDREQVERLDALIDAGLSGKDTPKWSGPADVLQAALREFANPTPPKPDEPHGLGAVVEDHRSMRFVRCVDGWLYAGGALAVGEHRNPLLWTDLRGVRVLSEGVTAC